MNRKHERNNNTDGSGRVKFRYSDSDRYMDIEMEGVTDTLADGLKSLATAISRGTVTAPLGRLLTQPKPPATPAKGEQNGFTPDIGDEEEDEAQFETASETSNGNVTDRAKRKYVPRAPQFLSSLDLTSGSVPLEEFVKQKNPVEIPDKYAVIATWFKEHRQLDEITADHIFTAFKLLKWQIPDDPGQPLRDLKSKKHWFDKGGSKGGYKINFLGTNSVAKMEAA